MYESTIYAARKIRMESVLVWSGYGSGDTIDEAGWPSMG